MKNVQLPKIHIRKFVIIDLDCEIIVEVMKRQKDIFDYISEYTENLEYLWFDPSYDIFSILYKDGSFDYIDLNYDGHKIKKKNVLSMVYNNACTSIVYGNFEINEYGVVYPSEYEKIATNNIIEIKDG